jgi:transposase InsO family protein
VPAPMPHWPPLPTLEMLPEQRGFVGVGRGYYNWRHRAPSARVLANLVLTRPSARRTGTRTKPTACPGCAPSCVRPGPPSALRRQRPALTYIPTWTGFLYLAVVVDAFSRKVVGWSMGEQMTAELVLAALNMALHTRRPDSVIHHSDQGSKYTSIAFGSRCREMGVRPSMGTVGDAYDNAMAESFFASLECELINRRSWKSQAEARTALFTWIEGWYNPRRRHSALDNLGERWASHAPHEGPSTGLSCGRVACPRRAGAPQSVRRFHLEREALRRFFQPVALALELQ